MFKEHTTHSCYITFVVFCVFFYFIILSEGQMTENKTIIYTLLMCMPGLPAYSFGGATFSIRTKTTSVYMREGEMGKIQTKKFLFRSLGLSKMVDVVHIRCERQRSFLWETQTYPLSSSSYSTATYMLCNYTLYNDAIVTIFTNNSSVNTILYST